MPSPSMLQRVTISSMPAGESVSITAVPEARVLKLVFTAMPWPSLPTQSPASDCSFLKAAAECAPADSGAAMDAASNRSSESLRRVTDASWKRTAQDVAPQRRARRDLRALTPEVREWKRVYKDGFMAPRPAGALTLRHRSFYFKAGNMRKGLFLLQR